MTYCAFIPRVGGFKIGDDWSHSVGKRYPNEAAHYKRAEGERVDTSNVECLRNDGDLPRLKTSLDD